MARHVARPQLRSIGLGQALGRSPAAERPGRPGQLPLLLSTPTVQDGRNATARLPRSDSRSWLCTVLAWLVGTNA